MPEKITEKSDIIGIPVSELSYDDFKPYIGQFVIYRAKREDGTPLEIIAIGDTAYSCKEMLGDKFPSNIGLIKLLEQGNWRNYDFLVGIK